VLATAVAPAMWSDYKALRDAQPVDRMGSVLVYRGTFYLPNVRADALLDRAETLLEESKPELIQIENLLNEALALRPTDFGGWMMLGNVNLLRGDREKALAAYRKASDVTPPSPFQRLFEDQIRLVSTQPINSVAPMRDPGVE
jgi:cytochrome c-type biogenesis protein CcmH/NrfG